MSQALRALLGPQARPALRALPVKKATRATRALTAPLVRKATKETRATLAFREQLERLGPQVLRVRKARLALLAWCWCSMAASSPGPRVRQW